MPDFLCSTQLLYKILPTNLVACKSAFILFIHHIGGKQYSKALFAYRTDLGELSFALFKPINNFSFSHFCKTNCTHSIFHTIHASPLQNKL